MKILFNQTSCKFFCKYKTLATPIKITTKEAVTEADPKVVLSVESIDFIPLLS